MATSGASAFEPRSKKLLDFVCRIQAIGASITVAPDEPGNDMLQSRGFERLLSRPEPGALPDAFPMWTAIKRHYKILLKKQPYADVTVTLPVKTTLSVSLETIIAGKPSLSLNERDAILNAFAQFDPATDGDLNAYAAKKLADYNAVAASKLDPSDFDLFYAATFTVRNVTIFDHEEQRLEELYRNTYDVCPGLVNGDGNLYGNGYEKIRGLDEYLWNMPPPETFNTIPVPGGTLNDPQAVDNVLSDFVQQSLQGTECNQQTGNPIKLRIASIRLEPATRTEWKWGYIRNTCGGGFHFYYPVVEISDKDKVLYALLSYPTLEEGLRTIFEECLEEAAREAAVISIVFGNLKAAIDVFLVLLWNKVKARIRKEITCLVGNLVLVEEILGNWRQL